MGNMLSAAFGYGIVIPNGEDDDHDWDSPYLAEYADGDYTDWGSALDDLAEKLNLVYDMAYVHDYNAGSVLFARPVASTYEPIGPFQKIPEISVVQVRALEVAAGTLGIPFEPTWILVASYG